MKSALVGLVVVSGVLAAAPAADAKTQRRPSKHQKTDKGQKADQKADKPRKGQKASTATRDGGAKRTAKAERSDDDAPERADERAHPGKAPASASSMNTRAARTRSLREYDRDRIVTRVIAQGQSIGAPWAGRLQHPSELLPGDGYVIRRPYRAFGTEATVAFVERAITETRDEFPDAHVLAIGDISAESGGLITQHRSHQSGRDIDIGLFYNEQPAGYPASFIHADAANLDCAATFKLLESILASANEDGGAQVVFLDFDVQGVLYDWAIDQGISERRLGRIFQYPHGRGSYEGLVRHEPNHDNHMHVRFRCPSDDSACGDSR